MRRDHTRTGRGQRASSRTNELANGQRTTDERAVLPFCARATTAHLFMALFRCQTHSSYKCDFACHPSPFSVRSYIFFMRTESVSSSTTAPSAEESVEERAAQLVAKLTVSSIFHQTFMHFCAARGSFRNIFVTFSNIYVSPSDVHACARRGRASKARRREARNICKRRVGDPCSSSRWRLVRRRVGSA